MGEKSALARAYLEVHLDKRALGAELNQFRTEIAARFSSIAPKVPIKIDSRGVVGGVKRAVLAAIKGVTASVPVQIASNAAAKLFGDVQRAASQMKNAVGVKIPIAIDPASIKHAVAVARNSITAMAKAVKVTIPVNVKAANIPIKVDAKGVAKAARSVRAAINKMAKSVPITIPVRIDTRAQGKLVRKIKSISRGLARRLAIKIPVKVDSPRASIAIRRLRRDVIKYVAKNPITIPVRLVPVGMEGMHQTVKRGMGKVKSSMLGTFRNIATIAAGILASIGIYRLTDAVRGLMGAMIGGNAQMEQYLVSMRVLMKDAPDAGAAAQQMMRDIEAFASTTPFEIPGLTAAVQQLLKADFAADKVLDIMKDIGDVASSSPMGMSTAIQRISYALMQMKQAGKVYGQDMRQLTDAGVPAWKLLAEEMGVSVSEVKKLTESGAVDAETAITAILAGVRKQFGGMMKEQSKSWNGLMSTLRDYSGIMLRGIGKPIFELAKVKLTNLVDWMQSKDGEAFVERMKKGMEEIIAYAKSIGKVISAVWKSPLGKALIIVGGISVAVASVAAGITLIGSLLAPIAGAFAAVLAPVTLVSAAVVALGASFKMALASSHGDAIRETLSEIWELIKEIGANLRDMLAPVVEWIGQKFKSAFGIATESSGSFWESLLGWVRETLDMLSLLTTNWDLTWKLFKSSAQLQLIRIGDFMANYWNDWKASIADGAAYAVEAAKALGDALTGKGDFGDIHRRASEAGMKAYDDVRKPGLAESPEQKMLRNEIRRLADEMVKSRDDKRREREEAKGGEFKRMKKIYNPETGEKEEVPEKSASGKELGKVGFLDLAEYSRQMQTNIGSEKTQQNIEKATKETAKATVELNKKFSFRRFNPDQGDNEMMEMIDPGAA